MRKARIRSEQSKAIERRGARRFDGPLRVDLWSQDQNRDQAPRDDVKNFSLRGFYFFSNVRRNLGSVFNFSMLFRKPSTLQEVDLVRGVAKVVRCEDLPLLDGRYGIAAKIERTTYQIGEDPIEMPRR
jgi:hypothetical protein